jgi:MYXO-CTERM domain-containing protein
MGGNMCPASLFCSSTTMAVGMCSSDRPDAGMPPPPPPADAGTPPVDAGHLAPGGKLGGGGFNCRISVPGAETRAPTGLITAVLALLALRRRRRRD